MRALLLVGGGSLLPGEAVTSDFQSEFELDLASYAGLWYEAARTPNDFQDNTLKRDGERFGACFDSTAEYALEDPETIRITNRCLRRSETGTQIGDEARGEALIQEGSGGRKLKLAFGPRIVRWFQRLFFDGGFDYWIYCLGPVNDDGLYDWAVVSGPDREYLFVLTRARLVAKDALDAILACARSENLPVDDLVYRQGLADI